MCTVSSTVMPYLRSLFWSLLQLSESIVLTTPFCFFNTLLLGCFASYMHNGHRTVNGRRLSACSLSCTCTCSAMVLYIYSSCHGITYKVLQTWNQPRTNDYRTVTRSSRFPRRESSIIHYSRARPGSWARLHLFASSNSIRIYQEFTKD